MRKFLSSVVLLLSCVLQWDAVAATCPAATSYVKGDSAQFVSQLVPAAMAAGRTYSVSITFCNNGTSTWKYLPPPAGGKYGGTTSYYRLGSLDPADNTNWGAKRIDLVPGDVIAPGSTKIFAFSVVAPTSAVTSGAFYDFQWGVVREQVGWLGAAPNVRVGSFYAPNIQLQNVPKVAPVALPSSDFTFQNFAGANVLNLSYLQAGNNHRAWIPNTAQMTVIASQAVALRLDYIRIPLVIPPDAANPEMVASEWYAQPMNLQPNKVNVNNVVNAAQSALRIAGANGLKVIFVLDGYTEYDTACAASMKPSNRKFWKKSFDAVKTNAATIVRALSGYSALYAWDIMNEPLWNASAYGCLDASPNDFDRGTQQPSLSLVSAHTATDQSIAEVVEAVHAMYNLVRDNDAYNHPTTVGEGQAPYLHYWNDISSFASPHIYVSAQGIVDAQIQANATNTQARVQVLQFGGAPLTANKWQVADPLIQAQVPGILAATAAEMKAEITTNGVQLPLIVGEYGADYPEQVLSPADQAAYYSLFLSNPSGGLQTLGLGNMLWDLSTGNQAGANFSLLSPAGTLLPAACVVAKAHGATPSGC